MEGGAFCVCGGWGGVGLNIHYWIKHWGLLLKKNIDTMFKNLFSYKIHDVDNTRKTAFISNKENTDRNALSQFSLLQKWRQKLRKLKWTLNNRWKMHEVTYITWHCVWKDAEGHCLYTMHTFFRKKAEMTANTACMEEISGAKW